MILITRDGERLVTALETIAQELNSQNRITELQERIEHLESLLKQMQRLMLNPKATDEEWESLLARVQETVP